MCQKNRFPIRPHVSNSSDSLFVLTGEADHVHPHGHPHPVRPPRRLDTAAQAAVIRNARRRTHRRMGLRARGPVAPGRLQGPAAALFRRGRSYDRWHTAGKVGAYRHVFADPAGSHPRPVSTLDENGCGPTTWPTGLGEPGGELDPGSGKEPQHFSSSTTGFGRFRHAELGSNSPSP